MLIKVVPTTVVEVYDWEGLIWAGKRYGKYDRVVGTIIAHFPPTPAQLRHLPKYLLAMTEFPNDSIAWLERLFQLADPRS